MFRDSESFNSYMNNLNKLAVQMCEFDKFLVSHDENGRINSKSDASYELNIVLLMTSSLQIRVPI